MATRKPNPKFSEPLKVKPAAQPVLGKTTTYPGMTKKFWDYVKGKKLQNPENRREILVGKDANLSRLFPGKKKISMFDVSRGLHRQVDK